MFSEYMGPHRLEVDRAITQRHETKQIERICKTFVAFFASAGLFAPNKCPIWIFPAMALKKINLNQIR